MSNISLGSVEVEAEHATTAINNILGQFTARTGCILDIQQVGIRDEFGIEVTGTKVETRVILGVV